MSINRFELTLASYLEYKGQITFSHFEEKYQKSSSSLKRHIYNLNSYLPLEKHYTFDGEAAWNHLSYQELLSFIETLDLSNYLPSKEERIYAVIISCFFNLSVNMSQLYEGLLVSQSTRKSDSKELDIYLEQHRLSREILQSKGIRIAGSEANFRLLTAYILSRYLEISLDDKFVQRRANNPMERMMVEYFLEKSGSLPDAAARMVNHFILEESNTISHPFHLSYPSKKYLLLYTVLSLYRNQKHIFISEFSKPMVNTKQYDFFHHPEEDETLSHLIGSFDFQSTLSETCYDARLYEVAKTFLEHVANHMITVIYTQQALFDEVYAYLKKALLTATLRNDFYDIKLDETHVHIKNMYQIVKNAIIPVEQEYMLTFSQSHIAALTLIFRKYVLQNRIAGRNIKSIVIVTNSSTEMAAFFYECLKQYVDVSLERVIHINELHLLDSGQSAQAITFSNRIKMLLTERGIPCIRLNYYITDEDIQLLFKHGFSTSKRKILLDSFAQEIAGKTKEEIVEFVKEHYDNYFVTVQDAMSFS